MSTRDKIHENVNCIEQNLWLGDFSAALNITNLLAKNVKFILTLDSCVSNLKQIITKGITVKFIKVYDSECEDILSYLDETFDFLESSLKNGGVLVHCFSGISRSSAVVIAYIMKSKRWNLERAYKYVEAKRKSIKPNFGFCEQLKLYENMEFTVDKSNLQYKMFKLYLISEQIKETKSIPQYFVSSIKVNTPVVNTTTECKMFRCKRCRIAVASLSSLIPHASNQKCCWKDENWEKNLLNVESCIRMFFIEPLYWMKNVLQSLQGKLYCPGCRSKIGSFNWVKGCQCPCGTVVTPGFSLTPSKID